MVAVQAGCGTVKSAVSAFAIATAPVHPPITMTR